MGNPKPSHNPAPWQRGVKLEHAPTSALALEAVIYCRNHMAHAARLRNATVTDFLPINGNI